MHQFLTKLLRLLERTPAHPQWLALRLKRRQEPWLAQHATGRTLDIGCADQRRDQALGDIITQYTSVDLPATGGAWYGANPSVWATAEMLPFGDGLFDTVLMLDVLEHVPDANRALAEASRVLKDTGVLLLSVPYAYPVHDAPFDFRRWTPHGLMQECRQARMDIIDSRELGSSVEAGCCATSIGIAKAMLEALKVTPVWVVLVPFAGLAITGFNVIGWLLSLVCQDRGFMPLRIHVAARPS